MLVQLARHGLFDLTLSAEGDRHIDDHHTAEDCGIVLGQLFDRALGDRRGIVRFAHALCPLDEALAEGASRWKAIIAEHGAAAILPYSYSGTLGVLQNVDSAEVAFAFGDANSSALVTMPGRDDFKYVVMPMRI